MKILQVIHTLNPASGGPIEGLRQLIPIYRNGGHEVEVASFDAPEMALKYDFPVKVFALGPGWGVYGYSRHAAPWFKTNVSRYDVVLIDGIWQYPAFVAHQAAVRAKVPFAVFTHGMLDPRFKRRFPLKHVKKSIYWHCFLQRILRDATAVLFTCEEEKILARQSFSRYRVSEVVVPYGTFGPDCNLVVAAEEFLGKWPILRGKRLAICLGRIHPTKGTDLLIQAFANTLARDPAWHLVIAGPDQVGLQKQLEALAAKLGIADRITWTGMLKGSLKWGALAASEVFVLPSHQESFGIAVTEAMACSLPVILSDKFNIWREIVDYRAGLVGDDTIEGTQISLQRWSALTAEERTAFHSRSKTCFDELFNYDVTSKRTLEILEHVAASSSQSHIPAGPILH